MVKQLLYVAKPDVEPTLRSLERSLIRKNTQGKDQKTHTVASWRRSRWSRWIFGWTAFNVVVAKSSLSSMVMTLNQWSPWWSSIWMSAQWRTSRSMGGSTPPQAEALIRAVDHELWTSSSTSDSTSVLLGPFWPKNSISFLSSRNNRSTTGVSTVGTSTTTRSSLASSDEAAVASTEDRL